MNVICIQEEAFNELIEIIYKKVKDLYEADQKNKWLSAKEAMQILHITSKTTLQKLRDTGCIRFTNVATKNILYDAVSINDYLEKRALNCF